MLTAKFIRENIALVETSLKKRRSKITLDSFKKLEIKRLALIRKLEEMKAKRNRSSKQIGLAKKQGANTDELMAEMKHLSEAIDLQDAALNEIDGEVENFCLQIPNILDEEVPVGADESSNRQLRAWGTPKTFSFSQRDHVELGEKLGILDFERAAKVSGSRFVFLKGKGAILERALMNFFLHENTERGYTELSPPLIVKDASLRGTGQLPKFYEDLFRLNAPKNYYLLPTAEVPLTNFVRDEILDESILPLKFTAYSPCFRSEAGAAGKDTRGMIRMHQFNKVEIVKICSPQTSQLEHESLLEDAENLLQKLELPYRVMSLCSGDIGFGAAKCYDLEVWLPSRKGYLEISSCSHFRDFQANRAGIRIRDPKTKKNIPAHTLNGSALAIGRTAVAIMENGQDEKGNIHIPKALVPYTGFEMISLPLS